MVARQEVAWQGRRYAQEIKDKESLKKIPDDLFVELVKVAAKRQVDTEEILLASD